MYMYIAYMYVHMGLIFHSIYRQSNTLSPSMNQSFVGDDSSINNVQGTSCTVYIIYYVACHRCICMGPARAHVHCI